MVSCGYRERGVRHLFVRGSSKTVNVESQDGDVLDGTAVVKRREES
jgi:hypothetical protein